MSRHTEEYVYEVDKLMRYVIEDCADRNEYVACSLQAVLSGFKELIEKQRPNVTVVGGLAMIVGFLRDETMMPRTESPEVFKARWRSKFETIVASAVQHDREYGTRG